MQRNQEQTRKVIKLGFDFITGLIELHCKDRHSKHSITSDVGADLSLTIEMFIAMQRKLERQNKIRERFIDCLKSQEGKFLPPLCEW